MFYIPRKKLSLKRKKSLLLFAFLFSSILAKSKILAVPYSARSKADVIDILVDDRITNLLPSADD